MTDPAPAPLPPLVYSCSGCSSAAQLANHVALQLDRRGVAEMSCIAGVGGDVPHLMKIVRSGRPIIALDGCPLNCVQGCLTRHGITADRGNICGSPALTSIRRNRAALILTPHELSPTIRTALMRLDTGS